MSEQQAAFMPFYGVDQRSGPLTKAPYVCSELLNVDLHPVGTVRTRAGYAAFSTPQAEAVTGLSVLEKISEGRLYLLSFGSTAVSRTQVRAGDPAWTAVHTYSTASSTAVPLPAVGRYVENSNTASPTDRGDVMYCADGARFPSIELGLEDTATTHVEMPLGVYGDLATEYSGTAGVPTAATGQDEWRDWQANPPAGFYLRGEGKQDRLYAWGFADDPNRIDYSEYGQPWNFLRVDLDGTTGALVDAPESDGGWFYAIHNDGDKVVGVTALYDTIVVFKRKKTLIYTGQAGSSDFGIKAWYPVGCSSYRSVVQVGTDLMWWSPEGPVSLSGVERYGDLQYANLGAEIIDEIALTTARYNSNVIAYHDPANYRVVWLIPQNFSSTPNKAVVMYYDEPRRWTVWDGDLTECISVHRGAGHDSYGDVVYGGRSDGSVVTLGVGSDEAEFASHYTTQWLDFGAPDRRKRLLYMDLIIGSEGAEDLELDVGWEYSDLFTGSGRIARALGSPSAYWGFGIWGDGENPGTVPGAATWGGTAQVVRRWDMSGTGFSMRLKLSSLGTRPFTIHGWRPTMSLKGSR